MPLTISFPLNPAEGEVYIFTGIDFSAVYTFKNGIWTTGTGITGMLASDLIGTTLAPNVVISSLTSVGTLTELTVTNPIVGSVTGNAATATDLQSILPINKGGTGNNAPARALNALLPTQTGNSGKFLRTNATDAHWSSIPGFSDESLTGEVTTVGLASTINNNAVIGKVLTGYTSGAGTVVATDTILQAIQKLNGNTEVGTTEASALTGETLASNVLASSLTSVGTLAGLTVTATIAGSINGNAATATSATSATTSGTVTTAAQPSITSVGTLTDLTVTSTIVGSIDGNAATATTATTAGTVTTAAQPTITSVGTLTAVNTSGVITGTDATASTSSTTGAVITAGGLGVAGAAFIGDGATVLGADGLTIKDDIADTKFLNIYNDNTVATYIVKRGHPGHTLNILHENFGAIYIGDSDGDNNGAYIGVDDNLSTITLNAPSVEIPQGAITSAKMPRTTSDVYEDITSSGTYTIVAADDGKIFLVNLASGKFTVDFELTGLDVGFHCKVMCITGNVSFSTTDTAYGTGYSNGGSSGIINDIYCISSNTYMVGYQ